MPVVVATDGGVIDTADNAAILDESDDECEECDALPGGFPCAECYISGEKDLPTEDADT